MIWALIAGYSPLHAGGLGIIAVISVITPPVALASFAAAGMAQADPWKTSWTAPKMGMATFIVPFMLF